MRCFRPPDEVRRSSACLGGEGQVRPSRRTLKTALSAAAVEFEQCLRPTRLGVRATSFVKTSTAIPRADRPPSATRVARSDSQPCITCLDNVRRTYIYVARD